MNKKLEYIVDKEKKQITCVASNCSHDIIDMLKKKSAELPQNTKDVTSILAIYNFFIIPSTISATVTCSDTDTFDEEVGKKIACAKMRRKYHKIINKKFQSFRTILENYINFFMANEWKSSVTYERARMVFSLLSETPYSYNK